MRLILETWQYMYGTSTWPPLLYRCLTTYSCQVINRHCTDFNTWRRHQMETFSALLALSVGNSPVTGEFPSQRPVTPSFYFSLICAWTNSWVNSQDAGDLRRYCPHSDVSVMTDRISSLVIYDFTQCPPWYWLGLHKDAHMLYERSSMGVIRDTIKFLCNYLLCDWEDVLKSQYPIYSVFVSCLTFALSRYFPIFHRPFRIMNETSFVVMLFI